MLHYVHQYFTGFPLAPYSVADSIYALTEQLGHYAPLYGYGNRLIWSLRDELEDLASNVRGGWMPNRRSTPAPWTGPVLNGSPWPWNGPDHYNTPSPWTGPGAWMPPYRRSAPTSRRYVWKPRITGSSWVDDDYDDPSFLRGSRGQKALCA
ncbi:hypothetical protein BAUCODRAFT_39477 [Baudoinia panamericana UAMH 10762]|uniref:Uncharacterized protein n=1 Tax=Baudoinia panamericana (strain UAMH 10762) TaxID=717646 RepID=M2MXC5_BAUPA|nr:uncharacterized protein BAUCODRAFT_39477 [Baudoinia panamericana UAMH 10762]EMC91309.1 hypothetical protein BAUCODRAFT_39477 [Baudoinia panamericana UAMH 10762]